MPQLRSKAHKIAPKPKKTGWSTWNRIEKDPKYAALAALHPKIPFDILEDFEPLSNKFLATPLNLVLKMQMREQITW